MKKEIFGYKSFEDLFNQYFEDLMRFVYGYVGNEEVARDIVHDVFLTFWNHREHLDFSWSFIIGKTKSTIFENKLYKF